LLVAVATVAAILSLASLATKSQLLQQRSWSPHSAAPPLQLLLQAVDQGSKGIP
jgi:hypothetical protein